MINKINKLSKVNNINNNVFNPIMRKTINMNKLIINQYNNGNFEVRKLKVVDENVNKYIINNNKSNINNNINIQNNNFNSTLIHENKSLIKYNNKINNCILKKALIQNINMNQFILDPQKNLL